ncbi:MAG: hypothetical protein KHY26_00420 [Faecalibacterium prausnitzii]|nr:hypothetical protein [Faecalibacterium prausnitzii]
MKLLSQAGCAERREFLPADKAIFRSNPDGLQGKATQYASKKTVRAVCNAYENGFTGAADSAPVLYYNHPASKIQP